MNDVMKVATDRRAELHKEIARLDDFIRMAESLMRRLQPGAGSAETLRENEQADETRHFEQNSDDDREAARGTSPSTGLGAARMTLLRRGTAAPAG